MVSKQAIQANQRMNSGFLLYPIASASGWLKSKHIARNKVDVPARNQNEVLNVFSLFSSSDEKRKNAVSKPKVKIIFTNEIIAYKLVNCANSSLLM